MMDPQLLIATIGHITSGLLVFVLGAFVFFQNPTRGVNVLFFLFAVSAAQFGFFFSWAINLSPSPLAYTVWMFNTLVVFITPLYLHFVLLLTGKARERKWLIGLAYLSSIAVFTAAHLFPHAFLPEVTEKLFVKSYLNAGPLYVAMFVCYSGWFAVATIELILAYFRPGANRTQIEYFLFASLLGYGLGPMDFFLVFDIPVSILFGMFYGLYVIPIAYGIVAKNLLDIRVVFKRAFFYALGIGLLAGILVVLTLLNNLLIAQVPWIQFWTVPVFTAIAAFILGRIFWKQSQEADRLKYEFITVAAHKLRTPLTRIRWEISAIQEKATEPEVAESLKHIDESNNRLIELTNVLLEAAHTEDVSYWYRKEQVDLAQAVKDASTRFVSIFKEKGITITTDLPETPLPVIGDRERLVSAIEVFIENASVYTPQGGRVHIAVRDEHHNVTFSVQDTGIGVSLEDREHIFTRFFRTDVAKRADTEGVGLGLAMAKSIIEKHRGRLGVISAGEGKGATFWFSLPK